MNRLNQLIILSIAFLFFACKETNTSQETKEDILQTYKKEFFKEKKLDGRTTFLEVKKKNLAITGQAQSEKLKEDFGSFLQQKNQDWSNQIKVIKNAEVAYIKNSVGNVRSAPKHSAELSTQYLLGQKVRIYKTSEDKEWYYIQGPDNYLGWIDHGGIVKESNTSSDFLNAPKKRLFVNELTAYENTDKTTVCCDLVFGNTLGKIAANIYVLPTGKKIYVNDKNFNQPKGKEIDLVLEKANSLMGRPYLWGGTSVKGMDCSGFSRMAYMNAGYLLGRDASLQVNEGKTINPKNQADWEKGDLLFFGEFREDGSEKITHVGIHTGNGKFIHESQQVRVESLNPSHKDFNSERAKALLQVRRIFE